MMLGNSQRSSWEDSCKNPEEKRGEVQKGISGAVI